MLHALLLACAASDPAALERALDTPRAASILADIGFVASDELEGRDTPSHGLRLAARYLRARLERLGFTACGDEGYFDQYGLFTSELAPASGLEVRREGACTRLAFGRECSTFGSALTDLELSGPVTFVGRASSEDFAGLDLKGRFALATTSPEVSFSERSRNALAAGAAALLMVPPADASDEGDWWSGRIPLRTRVEGVESRRGSSTLPLVWLSRSGQRAVLAGDALPALGTTLPVELTLRIALEPEREERLENVCGLWPGSDPELSKEVMILSAHYDHVGKQGGEIHNGADDNGSGTCGLLAVAEALRAYGPLRRSVLLLWVSGEEKGLWGSSAWTRHPTLPEGYRAVLDLNLDMIGRNEPGKLLITPSSAHEDYNGLSRLAEELAPLEGFATLGSADEFWTRSDHVNFARNLGIPVAFLFCGEHEDYHKPTDDPEKIDGDKVRRVVRLVVRMLDRLQGEELPGLAR